MMAKIPVRIQRKRTKGWQSPPSTRYCGRPSKYANPIRVIGMAQQEAVNMYKQMLEGGELPYTADEMAEELHQYDFLSCWCREGEPCHVDVIIEEIKAWYRRQAMAIKAAV